MKYLVVVESPAKINKIQQFLNSISGHSFIVEASYGHIRYFANGITSINISNDFNPTYSIIKDKNKVVKRLKDKYKSVDEVIIATDIDREGEAIGYHIASVLGLDLSTTKRICFNEITKQAVVDAFHNHRTLDINLIRAQETRSILDILIGFELSPVLWKHIQGKLSAGRCQSPALKLLYDKHQIINNFVSNKSYIINAEFSIVNNIYTTQYIKEIDSKDCVCSLLPQLISYKYKLDSITNKLKNITPPPPYITSSIQQDASSKLGYSPKQTMSILQSLYEKGYITYMRTDATFISDDFLKDIQKLCDNRYPGLFEKRVYKQNVANAQEAHECIRPVSLDEKGESFETNEQKMYNLIYSRTIASQMKLYTEKQFTYTLTSTTNSKHKFQFTLIEIIENGYKYVYTKTISDDKTHIQTIKKNDIYSPLTITATEKNTKPVSLYTEASLINELEKKGIGRPSTFATIISKLLLRKYAIKHTNHNYTNSLLEIINIKPNSTLTETTKKTKSASNKNKLEISDIGILVCEFLNKNFTNINSYEFTANVETDLDKISLGETPWNQITQKVYDSFHPSVDKLMSLKSSHKDQKRNHIGTHLNKNVYIFLGKYGPCIQYGEQNENATYISIDKNKFPELSKITVSDIVDLLKYPIQLGQYKKADICVRNGPHGLYIQHNKQNISIDSHNITLEEAIELIKVKSSNIILDCAKFQVVNGKYGPYIKNGSKNIPIPKNIDPSTLTKEMCQDIISNYKPSKKYSKRNHN